MMIFNRHERCIGLKLWSSKTRFVQVWFCPRGYRVAAHSHNDQNIELMYILGKTTFYRVASSIESFTPIWKHMFRSFSVKAGQVHWFTVSSFPLVFVNFATFLNGKQPTSAAVDFHKV